MIRTRGKSYQVLVYDPAVKKKVNEGTRSTMKEARALEREREAYYAQRGAGARTLIAPFVERWLQERSAAGARNRWRETTLRTNAEASKRLVRDFGAVELGALTKDETTPWAIRNPGSACAARACFAYAVQLGLIHHNPFAKLGVLGSRKRQIAPDWLTAEDVEAIAATASQRRGAYGEHFAAVITFAAYTCMRPSELFALDWRDINLHDQEVRVHRQYYRRSRTFGPTKNGEARTIVLPPPAADVLMSMPRLSDEHIFATVRGKRFTADTHRYYWHEVARPGMDFYELRHFGATYLLEMGLSEFDVSIQMGHTDGGKLVREVYGHPSHARARERIKLAWAARADLVADLAAV